MTRPREQYEAALSLVALGRNDCEIARELLIPRRTIRDWRVGKTRSPTIRGWRCAGDHDFSLLPVPAYSYLLGLYLGDGCLSAASKSSWKLRLVMDTRYTEILDQCCLAMEAVMPDRKAHRIRRQGCVELYIHSTHWVCFFPQHGPGKKHMRPIHLRTWQQEIVEREPWGFLRGLIHSDGCRVETLDRGVPSTRYHFSNKSEDIKHLFCDALDRIGVPWTRPSDRDVAIYRKDAVAYLDEFIGPKR